VTKFDKIENGLLLKCSPQILKVKYIPLEIRQSVIKKVKRIINKLNKSNTYEISNKTYNIIYYDSIQIKSIEICLLYKSKTKNNCDKYLRYELWEF